MSGEFKQPKTHGRGNGSQAGHLHEIEQRRAFFRSVNDKIEGLSRRHSSVEGATFVFFCECGNPRCDESMDLPYEEYRQLFSHRPAFVVKSGHENPEIERVVAAPDGYVAIEPVDPRLELELDLSEGA